MKVMVNYSTSCSVCSLFSTCIWGWFRWWFWQIVYFQTKTVLCDSANTGVWKFQLNSELADLSIQMLDMFFLNSVKLTYCIHKWTVLWYFKTWLSKCILISSSVSSEAVVKQLTLQVQLSAMLILSWCPWARHLFHNCSPET